MDITIAPSQRSIGRREASKPLKVTGRLKRALDLMVWDNRSDNQAAVETGMTLTAIRLALQRPHVRAYVREQREVLRTREFGRNIHTLMAVRDQTANQMARVNAVKAMEQIDDDPAAVAARSRAPGVTIIIGGGESHTAHMREIEAKPLIEHEPDSHADGAEDT